MPMNRIKLTENIESEINNKTKDLKAQDTEIIELTTSLPTNTCEVIMCKSVNAPNNVELVINVSNKSQNEANIKQVVR